MKLWLARAVSFAIAWTIILLALGIGGELLDLQSIVLFGMLWTCFGILARIVRSPTEVTDALPAQVDVGMALRFLLTCAAWPIVLMHRSK